MERALYYASLAISQHQTLKALLLVGIDAVELNLPLWSGNDELQINNETTQVLITRTKEQHAKRMDAYFSLKEEVSNLRRMCNCEGTALSTSLKKTVRALDRTVKTGTKISVKKKRLFKK